MICADVSDILYPDARENFQVRGKFIYRMYAFIVAVCARGHVTLYADNVYVDNVNG